MESMTSSWAMRRCSAAYEGRVAAAWAEARASEGEQGRARAEDARAAEGRRAVA